MLIYKVTEFYGELGDFPIEFASQQENRPLLEDSNVKAKKHLQDRAHKTSIC
jgi:hypothetical protein